MPPLSPSPDSVIEEIRGLFDRYGSECYGEDVTQLEHAVQVGLLALSSGKREAMVVAAFLHDIGHLCSPGEASMEGFGLHHHDSNGGNWARERGFSEEVARLIENHVAAKRYLTAVDADYRSTLSAASAHTLLHQGGPMNPQEAQEFERDSLFHDHIQLRRWDETGKDNTADLHDLAPFLAAIRHHLEEQPKSPRAAAMADTRELV